MHDSQSPLAACDLGPERGACQDIIKSLRNPYFIGDQAGATQSSGWVDAWNSAPSVYAVAATSTADVAAAVNVCLGWAVTGLATVLVALQQRGVRCACEVFVPNLLVAGLADIVRGIASC